MKTTWRLASFVPITGLVLVGAAVALKTMPLLIAGACVCALGFGLLFGLQAVKR